MNYKYIKFDWVVGIVVIYLFDNFYIVFKSMVKIINFLIVYLL